MKKILLVPLLLGSVFISNAQINNVPAPNFSVTDINGVTHTLSTYLAQGKTVILDISATWCGPCWNFHNGKALEDLHNAFGPAGSNEIVVLFVEGDAATTLADLNGTGTNTQGNWVANTPYPIIDNAAIAQLYNIAYFPTLYRICASTGIATLINTASAATIRNGINTNCGTMTGVQNSGKITSTDIFTCTETNSPQVRIKNYGANPITSATVDLKENGTTVASRNFTGTTNMFGNATVNFNAIQLNPTSVYTMQLATINNVAPFNPNLAVDPLDINFANQSQLNIQVRVYTDNYPSEMSWRIKNGAGAIVASAGPYAGTASGGGVDANTTKIHNFTLADATDCFSVELADSYGDGWGFGPTPHGMEIFNGTTSVFNVAVGNFGTLLTRPGALKTVATLGVDEQVKNAVSLLPNPSKGIFTLTSEDTIAIQIYDITGKMIFSATELSNSAKIDLSTYSSGLYIAKIIGSNYNKTLKLIIE